MQSESKIRHRLKLLRLRHLEKHIRKATSRNPGNCKWNQLQDTNGPIPVRVCANPSPGFCGGVCDPQYNGKEIAARCDLFEPRLSADKVKEEFNRFLLESSGEELARACPDIMALLWVLGEQTSRNFEDVSPLDINETITLVIPEYQTTPLLYHYPTDTGDLPDPLVLVYNLKEVQP